jgi:hypothetical protein
MDPITLETINAAPEIVNPVQVPSTLDKPLLLPSVPSTAFEYNASKIVPKEEDILAGFLQNRQSEDAAPLYDYKTSQEKRYDNPFMQFTPQVQGSYSTEDAYGKNQGAGEQLVNSIVKLGATAGGTFISGFTSIPNQIDALRQGKVADALFNEDSSFVETQKWLEELENKFPNYMTEVETQRPWYINAFTPTGAANFWGDTVLKNAGFTIGALANALVVDSAIELATAGTATPATLILAGKQISTALKPLKSAFRALSKASTLNRVDDVVGIARMEGSLIGGLQATNKAFSFKKSGQFLATTYASTQGEAMIEGYHTYVDTKTQLLEEALNKGEQFTPELLTGIEQTASAAGKATAMLNMAVLGVSNAIQFPKIMGWAGGSDILQKASADYVKIQTEKGLLRATNTYTQKEGVKNVLKDLGIGFVTEGAEEGSQYYIGNSLHDYYIDKFNNVTKSDMLAYMGEALPETLQEGDFWKEVFIGGISGMVTGGLLPGGEVKQSFSKNLFGAKKRNDQYVSNLNESLDLVNNSIGELTNLDEVLNPTTTSSSDKFQTSYKMLHRAVTNIAQYGKLEDFKESLQELEKLPLEEYNKLFFSQETGLKTEADKLNAIGAIRKEVGLIERDLTEVEKNFKNNPFSTKKVSDYLMKKFKVDQRQVGNIQAKMFQDWKQNQAFTIGRLRNTQGRVSEIMDSLRVGSNISNESEFNSMYATLMTLGSGDTLSTYLAYKNQQIQALKLEEEMYEGIGDKLKKSEVTKHIQELQSLYSNIETQLNSKEKDPIKKFEPIQKLILGHELQGVDPSKWEAVVQEAREAEEIIDNAEQEIIVTNEDPERTAMAQADVVEDIINVETNSNPEVTVIEESRSPFEPPEMGFPVYNKLRELNDGITIILTTPQGVRELTIEDSRKTNVTTVEGVVFTPNGWLDGKVTNSLSSYEGVSFNIKANDNSNPNTSSSVEENQPVQVASAREVYQEWISGKEIVDNPQKIGGRYIFKNTRVPHNAKSFKYYIKESLGYRSYTYNQDTQTSTQETLITLDNSDLLFYSIDGEPVIQVSEPDVIQPENPVVTESNQNPIDYKALSEEIQQLTKLRNVLLTDENVDQMIQERLDREQPFIQRLINLDKDLALYLILNHEYGWSSTNPVPPNFAQRVAIALGLSYEQAEYLADYYANSLNSERKEELAKIYSKLKRGESFEKILTIEEKIDIFMSGNKDSVLKNVILSSIQKNALSLVC